MKRMQRFLRLASLLCLLTACATMQLAHMKQLQSTRQYEAIIAETPVASCKVVKSVGSSTLFGAMPISNSR